MEYQVDLETFRGPLDLLLYLVKRDEVDICDIPIAKIAHQFQEYLNVIHLIDVEWAGEFLVMASTLMEIKSKLLLPRSEEAETEEADPRMELVKQLIQYKQFKDASKVLQEHADQQVRHMTRKPVDKPRTPTLSAQPIQKVELWDLVSAFGRLMREISALQPQQIVMDDTPIHVHMENIAARLQASGHIVFRELFTPPHTRGRLLGLFLATLELVKGRRAIAEQPDNFGEIVLRHAEPAEQHVDETEAQSP